MAQRAAIVLGALGVILNALLALFEIVAEAFRGFSLDPPSSIGFPNGALLGVTPVVAASVGLLWTIRRRSSAGAFVLLGAAALSYVFAFQFLPDLGRGDHQYYFTFAPNVELGYRAVSLVPAAILGAAGTLALMSVIESRSS